MSWLAFGRAGQEVEPASGPNRRPARRFRSLPGEFGALPCQRDVAVRGGRSLAALDCSYDMNKTRPSRLPRAVHDLTLVSWTFLIGVSLLPISPGPSGFLVLCTYGVSLAASGMAMILYSVCEHAGYAASRRDFIAAGGSAILCFAVFFVSSLDR
jgi:hypothetical protein